MKMNLREGSGVLQAHIFYSFTFYGWLILNMSWNPFIGGGLFFFLTYMLNSLFLF